jgi:hypothetical protein
MSGPELERQFGFVPPIMASYAAELAALCPSEAAERSLIGAVLPAALARVGLSLSLAEDGPDRRYSDQ